MILEPKTLREYRNRLETALGEGDFSKAAEFASNLSEGRIARIVLDAPDSHVLPFLEQIGVSRAATIISLLPVEPAAELVRVFGLERSAEYLSLMPPDSAADILNQLPDRFSTPLLDLLPPERRVEVEELRRYGPDSVGSNMQKLYIGVEQGTTIEDTLTAIRDAPQQIENRSYIFVVSPSREVQGVVSVKDLLRANPAEPIDTLMTTHVVAVHATDPALEAAQLLRNRRLQMLPVLDEEHRLIGVFLLDDAIRILSESLVEQFVQIGAASVDESFYTPPLGAVRKRLPWMASNVFLNLGAVAVISAFEGTIEAVAALAVFLPMITDMGGNVGIQALSVSIRSIALGEVRLGEYWRAARKEVIVGLVNGLALGALFTLLAIILRGTPVLGLVAGVALAVNVLVAGIVGGTLPFLIKKMGHDPAMMTGPVLTTITDITGVSIYLGLSTIFLSSLLAG